MKFITHKNEIIEGQRLIDALNVVADKMVANAKSIRAGHYADHVTDEQKDLNLQKSLNLAQKVREGYFDNFTIWQRINTEITGECIALFQK